MEIAYSLGRGVVFRLSEKYSNRMETAYEGGEGGVFRLSEENSIRESLLTLWGEVIQSPDKLHWKVRSDFSGLIGKSHA